LLINYILNKNFLELLQYEATDNKMEFWIENIFLGRIHELNLPSVFLLNNLLEKGEEITIPKNSKIEVTKEIKLITQKSEYIIKIDRYWDKEENKIKFNRELYI